MSHESNSESAVSILLMGFADGARDALRGYLASAQWEVCEVSTCRQAVTMLDERACGVCICDSAIENGNWQSVLAHLRRRADPPNLIVSSRLADERLWAEVLNLGGYDVLAQPFERNEVLRVASMAWMSWRRSSPLRMSAAS
jgi:DNA-binding NtrC family response regulator